MQCLKCGNETNTTKCRVCGNDIKETSITTIWKISEELVKNINFLCDRITTITWSNSTKDTDLEKLSGIKYEEFKFKQGLYKGQFKNGKRNGFGIQYDINNKKSYAGDWLDDKKSGYGKIYTRNGKCEFEGWFKNGLRHGRGFDILPDGSIKESEWDEGERIDSVVKSFKNEKPINEETTQRKSRANLIKVKITQKHKWDETTLNIKDMERLSKTRKVKLTTSTGEYIGDVKESQRHGFGIQYDKLGHISYAGMWKDDKKHGKGRLYNQYGRCQFEGFFKFGYRDGAGIEFNKDGTTKESTWINGTRCT